MANRQQIIDVVPRFLNPGRNWSGKCEAAAWNLANALTPGAVRSFPDATSARKASTIEGPGLGPGGNWVWMSGVWGIENGRRVDWGHVAYHVGGGLLFMASSSVTDRIPGATALGFIDGLAYLRRFAGQKLEGWSYDHGGTVIPGDGPIVVPLPHISPDPLTTEMEDDDVSFAEQIDWRGGKVSAAALIVATAINAELAVAKVDALAAKLEAADYTRHNGIDAPNDVVDADTLKVVQQTEAKVNQLVQLLADTDVPSATA